MDVEDLLVAISKKLMVSRRKIPIVFGGLFDDAWHRSFISSVAKHVQAEHPLSTNQSRMICKMIARAQSYIVDCGIASQTEIDQLLAYPRHRHSPYVSAQHVPREVRYLGDNLLGLRCKADQLVTTKIKALGNDNIPRSRPRFDWNHKIWIVPVLGFNLHAIMTLLDEHRFRADAGTADYLESCKTCQDTSSRFAFVDATQTTLIVHVGDDPLLASWIIDVADGIVL